MDRAYRYGQVRDVYVYRLLGAGALEGESTSLTFDFLLSSMSPLTPTELIYARQIYKQQMMNIVYEGIAQTRFFDGVQGNPLKQGSALSG